MTPSHLQMMLHYYTRPTPYAEHEPEHANSPAVIEYRNTLINNGLLVKTEDLYLTTGRGEAYIKALLTVKIPVAKTIWVQPDKDED